MKVPEKFDRIRPFEPEELQEVFLRLLQNEQFRAVMAYVFPDLPGEKLEEAMLSCRNNLDFQLRFCYPFLEKLMQKAARGWDMDASAISNQGRYTFISNHRDIVLDSALLDKLLVDAGFSTTCEIAIGDNLLSLPWVKDLVRVNKSFIVERGLPMREMLRASLLLSEYMHFAITEKHENIWIAQREGRAKDSNDRTQEGVLKMIAMGRKGDARESLGEMHIVPLSISYEYDPCDYLKAREMQLRRDIKGWKKAPGDDLLSMKTGIFGFKGRVHYHCAPCIDEWLNGLPADMPKGDFFRSVAEHIDREIHKGYRLYPGNYVAWDLLEGSSAHSDKYTDVDEAQFEHYIARRLSLITDVPNRDEDFLRSCLLTMYANPAKNHEKALEA